MGWGTNCKDLSGLSWGQFSKNSNILWNLGSLLSSFPSDCQNQKTTKWYALTSVALVGYFLCLELSLQKELENSHQGHQHDIPEPQTPNFRQALEPLVPHRVLECLFQRKGGLVTRFVKTKMSFRPLNSDLNGKNSIILTLYPKMLHFIDLKLDFYVREECFSQGCHSYLAKSYLFWYPQ